MALPRGLKHFSDFFKDFESEYVIIGGSAAAAYLEDEGLAFRATRDIDIVLFTNNSKTLNAKISDYLALGEYRSHEKTDEKPVYYRFSKPEDEAYPEIIEIFARNDNMIELKEGQYTLPIQNDAQAHLSAILLDDEYFELIKNNVIKSAEGFSIINATVNVCLKARAYRELLERNDEAKKIAKHKKDILRLSQALDAMNPLPLVGPPRKDLEKILNAIAEMTGREIKQVIGTAFSKSQILDLLQKCFLE